MSNEQSGTISFRWALLGVFLVSAALLSLETLLPRMFAIYIAGNQTFFCISISMLGLSAGGIAVSIWERLFSSRIHLKLTMSALLFAVAVMVSTWLTVYFGSHTNSLLDQRYAALLADSATRSRDVLTIASIVPSLLFVFSAGIVTWFPFFFCGICLSLAIQFYSRSIGKVYAFDLVGAGVGGIITVVGLTYLSLSSAILFVVCLASVGALLFCVPILQNNKRTFNAIIATFLVFGSLFIYGIATGDIFDFAVHKYAFGRSLDETPLTEITYRWSPLGRIGLFTKKWSPPGNLVPRLRSKTFVGMDLGGHAIVETWVSIQGGTIWRRSSTLKS